MPRFTVYLEERKVYRVEDIEADDEEAAAEEAIWSFNDSMIIDQDLVVTGHIVRQQED